MQTAPTYYVTVAKRGFGRTGYTVRLKQYSGELNRLDELLSESQHRTLAAARKQGRAVAEVYHAQLNDLTEG